MRAYIRKQRIHALRAAKDRARKLTRGIFCAFGGLGVYDICHRFCRRQLHPAGQERALCEFAGACLTRAEGKYLLQRRAQHDRRAVALQLRRVFARIAVRGAAYRAHAQVEQRAVQRAQSAVDQLSVLIFRHASAARGEDQPVGNAYGVGAGEADYPDGRDLRARGDGGNGVRIHSSASSPERRPGSSPGAFITAIGARALPKP